MSCDNNATLSLLVGVLRQRKINLAGDNMWCLQFAASTDTNNDKWNISTKQSAYRNIYVAHTNNSPPGGAPSSLRTPGIPSYMFRFYFVSFRCFNFLILVFLSLFLTKWHYAVMDVYLHKHADVSLSLSLMYSSFGGTWAMTLGGAALTSVEKNSRPQLMSQRTSCTFSVALPFFMPLPPSPRVAPAISFVACHCQSLSQAETAFL
jgi:hypothetical protein